MAATEFVRCICGARACTHGYLERHRKRGECVGEAGRLLKQGDSGAPRARQVRRAA